eukprot:7384873-Prymnesium_polylepis.1
MAQIGNPTGTITESAGKITIVIDSGLLRGTHTGPATWVSDCTQVQMALATQVGAITLTIAGFPS